MSSFKDLISRDNEAKQVDAEERKANPFAALGKAVASVRPPVDNATAAGEVVSKTGQKPATSPATFSLNLGRKKEPSLEVAEVSQQSANASLAAKDATPPDDTMQGIAGDSFSETKSAMQFQSADQPEGYNQEIVDDLKTSLDILVNSIDNKELVGDALKKIMLDLKRHKFLVSIMHPEDCQLMVRAVRVSYGVTLAKKQQRVSKRAATSKEVDDVIDMLGDMDMSI